MITSTVTTKDEDSLINRKSTTHRTCRAFDLSINGWDAGQIKMFCDYFSHKYKDVAATNKQGESVLIPDVNHGTAPHIHVQINARYAILDAIDL